MCFPITLPTSKLFSERSTVLSAEGMRKTCEHWAVERATSMVGFFPSDRRTCPSPCYVRMCLLPNLN